MAHMIGVKPKIEASKEAAINVPKIERFVHLIRQEISNLDFDKKRLAMEMLDIKAWVDENSVEITGSIPIPISPIARVPSE